MQKPLDEEIELLAAQVGERLRGRGLKLVLAESCTGGLIGHRITNVPGSSEYFPGGVTSYANEAKQSLLGVRRETLQSAGAVSRETVLEMAAGVRRAFSAACPLDRLVGLAVSGIAGPGGGTPHKPVGLVWVGLSAPAGAWAWRFQFTGNRLEIKEQAAQAALERLLEYLQGRLSTHTG